MRTRSTIPHSLHGQLTNEVQNGVTIARTYDALNRPTGYSLMQNGGGGNPVEVSYTYDNLGLFSGVCFNAEAQRGRVDFEYSYLPGTDFVSGYTATKTSPQSGGNLGGSAAQTSPRSGINLLTRSVAYEPHRDLISSITNSFNSSTPNSSTHQLFFTTYDAKGNISEYVSTNGEIVAHYDYSPFGETLIETGDLAATFTHRFSTKPWCPVTGLYEYQMRKYRPGIGRWLSRDPIGDSIVRLKVLADVPEAHLSKMKGDCSSYVFVYNNPAKHKDYCGLTTIGEVLDEFFSIFNTRPDLWVMPSMDPYTSIVRKWGPVMQNVTDLKRQVAKSPKDWKETFKFDSLGNIVEDNSVERGW